MKKRLVPTACLVVGLAGLHMMDVAGFGVLLTNGWVSLPPVQVFHIGFYLAAASMVSLFLWRSCLLYTSPSPRD